MDSEKALIRRLSILGKSSFKPKLPIIGIIFALIASVSFYLCRTHDEQIWQELYSYHAEHLLQKEKLIYQDFYYKRLAIEQKGSESQLTAIKKAIKQKDKQTLSHIILSDRSFRTYLNQKASIYFSSKQKDLWINNNTTLTTQLNQLTTYRFALIPELFIASPSISNLITYNFIDNRLENLLSNIVLFLLLCSIAETFIKRGLVLGALSISSLVYGCAYLFIADSFSAPLQAPHGMIYFLFFMLSSAFIKYQYPKKFAKTKRYFLIGLLLFSLKIALDSYFNLFNMDVLMSLIPIFIIGLTLGWFIILINIKNQGQLSTEDNTQEFLTKRSRHQYSEALSALSRFNFNYSRQALQALRQEHPDSLRILESSYHLEKLKPEESNFWTLAESRIEHCLMTQNYNEMLSIFQDIQKTAPSRHQAGRHISPDHYLKILLVFVNHGDIPKAEQAFMFLDLAGNQTLVKEACKLLIETFSQKQNSSKKEHYQALIDSYIDKKIS
jgi:hypothetical protein